MNVLVDTSVWVAHFRHKDSTLLGLIGTDRVIVHAMVIGEIACGTPPGPRARTLGDLGQMRKANQATSKEVIELIERESLYGLGCGLVDMTLLASTLLTPGATLWTLDKQLASLADRFSIAYRP